MLLSYPCCLGCLNRKIKGQTDKGLFSAVVVPGEVGILDIFQIVTQKNALFVEQGHL